MSAEIEVLFRRQRDPVCLKMKHQNIKPKKGRGRSSVNSDLTSVLLELTIFSVPAFCALTEELDDAGASSACSPGALVAGKPSSTLQTVQLLAFDL